MSSDLSPESERLLAHIEEGTQQLRSGDFVEYDQEGLRRFFDEVQAEGRARFEASRKQQ